MDTSTPRTGVCWKDVGNGDGDGRVGARVICALTNGRGGMEWVVSAVSMCMVGERGVGAVPVPLSPLLGLTLCVGVGEGGVVVEV